MHVGIAGEVRCVVTKADGTVKTDTGFQKNLVLNQGLNFLGGGKGDSIFARCVIGSGNSTPAATQTALDSFIASATGSKNASKYGYADDGTNTYKTSVTYKYSFGNLDNVNVTEAGLASQGSTASNIYLCTRVLIKDSSGQPTSVTILAGEILEIYYKVWRVVSTLDASHTVNLNNTNGDTVPYNVVVRLASVGRAAWEKVGEPIADFDKYVAWSEEDLQPLTTAGPSTSGNRSNTVMSLRSYADGSLKRVLDLKFKIEDANIPIRTVNIAAYERFTFFLSQIRFGSVADDSPITKTNQDTLTIPLEFSWGRYEGDL